MTDNDKQSYINQNILNEMKDIKILLSQVYDKIAEINIKIGSHEERISNQESTVEDLRAKFWDLQSKLFWWAIALIATLCVTGFSVIIGLIKFIN